MVGAAESFIERNQGLWGLLALIGIPLAAISALLVLVAYVRDRRTAVLSVEEALPIMTKAVHSKLRRDGQLSFVTVGQLPLRIRDESGVDILDPVPHLFGRLAAGAVVRVRGPAGAGKSALAALLSQYSASRVDDGGPLVVTMSARQWRRLLPRRDHEGVLADWFVRELALICPQLGSGILRHLLATQRVVVCLDGLDEVPRTQRQQFVSAIRAFVAGNPGVPLGLFGRQESRQATSLRWTMIDSLPSDEIYDLLPLAQDVVDRFVRESSPESLPDARRAPFALDRLLNRPLTLSIAVQLYGDRASERLRSSDTPDVDLWDDYVASVDTPGGVPVSGRLGTAGVAALAITKSRRDTFNVWDIFDHRLGNAAAYLLVIVGAFLLLSRRDLLVLPLTFAVFLDAAARPERSPVQRLRRRITRGPIASWLVLVVLAACCYTLFLTARRIYEVTDSFTVVGSSRASSLWHHLDDPEFRRFWLTEVVWSQVRESVSSFRDAVLGPGLILGGIAAISVNEDRLSVGVILDLLPLPHGVTWRFPRAMYLTLLTAFVLAAPANPAALLLGGTMAYPLLAAALSAVVLGLGGWMALRSVPADMARLVRQSVLERVGATYRFRHPEIQERLARVTVDRIAHDGKLRTLGVREWLVLLVDDRVRDAASATASTTLESFHAAYRRDQFVANMLAMHRAWGLGDWAGARSALLTASRSRHLLLQLAEVELELGMVEESGKHMAKATRGGPRDDFELNRWVRWHAHQADCDIVASLFEGDSKVTKSDVALMLRLEHDCSVAADAEPLLHSLVSSDDDSVRTRAACLLVRSDIVRELDAVTLLGRLIEVGEPSAYPIACLARVQAARGRRATATELATWAYSVLSWAEDPRVQAYVLKVAQDLAPDRAAEAGRRLRLLEARGWSESLCCR